MKFPWFGKQKDGGEPPKQSSGQRVQQFMLRFAEEKLRTWLTVNMGADSASRVKSYVIEDSRVCAEALPFRIYIYDMDSPEGQLGFELLQSRSDAPGDVFEHTETTFEDRKLGSFLYRVHLAGVISLDPDVRAREDRSRATGRSMAESFHSELSGLVGEMPSESVAREGQPLSVGQLGDVAVYVRTSIVSTKYDTYKAKLEQFCRQQGWRNPRVYHDRAGGTVDEAELEKMARAMAEALKGGKVDADVIGRLAQMSETDAQHDRDDFKRLMVDINRGDIRVVVVHDLGQLGKSRLEAFGVLSDLMKRADVYMPGLGKIHGKTAFPPGSKTDYF